MWLSYPKTRIYRHKHGCWRSEKASPSSKLLTMHRHSLLLNSQSSKTTIWNSLSSTLMKDPAYLTHSITLVALPLHAAPLDLPLLQCALEDGWTSTFQYKSPSEPHSSDSDLITASNKRYQHHSGSGFISSFPWFFVARCQHKQLTQHWSRRPEKPLLNDFTHK